jgi:ABC-2 type transport system permease protein
LRSPLALAWRLQRGFLLAWLVGFAIVGTALGGMAATPEVIRESSRGHEFLSRYSGTPEASIVDIFLELVVVSLGMSVAFYPVLATLRLRDEEVAGRAELVLSTTVSRGRWAASHVGPALLGTIAVMATGGAALGLAHGLAANDAAAEVARVMSGRAAPRAGGMAPGGHRAVAVRAGSALRRGWCVGGPAVRAADWRSAWPGVSGTGVPSPRHHAWLTTCCD